MVGNYVNRFKFALNHEANAIFLVFEQEHPVLLRENGNGANIEFGAPATEEVASFYMDVPCARELARTILRAFEQAGIKPEDQEA